MPKKINLCLSRLKTKQNFLPFCHVWMCLPQICIERWFNGPHEPCLIWEICIWMECDCVRPLWSSAKCKIGYVGVDSSLRLLTIRILNALKLPAKASGLILSGFLTFQGFWFHFHVFQGFWVHFRVPTIACTDCCFLRPIPHPPAFMKRPSSKLTAPHSIIVSRSQSHEHI